MLWLSLFICITNFSVSAQTCCTAGAPILSGITINSNQERNFALALKYDYRSINRLIQNNEVLVNDPRSRIGMNTIVKASMTFSPKWSAGIIIPFIYQERATISERASSLGQGDIILTGQYLVFAEAFSQLSWLASVKFPTGKINHLDDRSIFLSPDMQSGSGTFDFINQLSFAYNQIGGSLINIETGVLYRINSTNENFAATQNSDGRPYKFGNEFQYIISFKRPFTINKWFVIPDLSLQYRMANANVENHTIAPNSGGQWLNAQVGIYLLPKEKLSIRPYFSFPLYQNLEGLQITTKLGAGIELGYNFSLQKN